MKRIERHKLKENDFAESVAKARVALGERQGQVTTTIVAVVAVLLIAGGFFAWRASRNSKATDLLATALAVAEAPVVTPPPPAPGSAPPVQQPGTFRTERDRLDAALPRDCMEAADTYPNTDAGITARFRAGRRAGGARSVCRGRTAIPGGRQKAGSTQHLRPNGASGSWERAARAREERRGGDHLQSALDRQRFAAAGRRRADAARTRVHAGRQEATTRRARSRGWSTSSRSRSTRARPKRRSCAEKGVNVTVQNGVRAARERELADARRRTHDREAGRRRHLRRSRSAPAASWRRDCSARTPGCRSSACS